MKSEVPTLSRWQWLWPIAVATAISAASGRSQIAAPDWDFIAVDKVGHFAVYGLLATLVVRMLRRGWRHAVFAAVLVSIYGATDEWHQSFTPGRSVELADWIVDTSSAILAVSAYISWARYRLILEKPLSLRCSAGKRQKTVVAPAH